jgi:hypothetical protein
MSLVTISYVHEQKPVAILHVLDRINLGNTNELELAARDAFQQGYHYILLDLTQVPSITSAGLRAILLIHRLLASESNNQTSVEENESPESDPLESSPTKSKYLKLLNASPEVLKVLTIAGFDAYLEFYNNQTEAINSF